MYLANNEISIKITKQNYIEKRRKSDADYFLVIYIKDGYSKAYQKPMISVKKQSHMKINANNNQVNETTFENERARVLPPHSFFSIITNTFLAIFYRLFSIDYD
jgi:hypothetical protein